MNVDRTHRIRSWMFAEANPDRFAVNRLNGPGPAYWGVWKGDEYHGAEPDFTTAIHYADRTAREEATK